MTQEPDKIKIIKTELHLDWLLNIYGVIRLGSRSAIAWHS